MSNAIKRVAPSQASKRSASTDKQAAPERPADLRGAAASQLQPVVPRPDRVADGHLDAADRPGLPDLRADPLAGLPRLCRLRGRRAGLAVHALWRRGGRSGREAQAAAGDADVDDAAGLRSSRAGVL